ncbi:hypothetical protein [Chromobacterium violaceum]|uniref:hypothetical protein n=1 Tax=Chromobacterium violaceum TaxID=536 RepID=UPI001C8B84E6|nr:hypothetical protein [Chromobacterium violaceum]MBX9268743.1 hypothetical protein [Chromobacterium violaceum]
MAQNSYILEFYEPNSTYDTLYTIESDQPFAAMSAGDLVNARAWQHNGETRLLKIVRLEHLFWKFGEKATHKILVFTDEVEDSSEARIPPSISH